MPPYDPFETRNNLGGIMMSCRSVRHTRGHTSAVSSIAVLSALGSLALAPLPAAIAQEAGGEQAGLEEIIVTSRYREENLQTTPLSISAFTGEALELRSLDNLEEIAVVVPKCLFGLTSATSARISQSVYATSSRSISSLRSSRPSAPISTTSTTGR
jgi:hypothetical protein